MTKIIAIIVLLFFINQPAISLNTNCLSLEYKFAEYLIDNLKYNDALKVISKMYLCNPQFKSGKDSISYIKALVFYKIQKMDSAIFYFNHISDSSVFYTKSKVFESFCYSYSYDPKKAIIELKKLNDLNDTLLPKQLFYFLTASNELLKRDIEAFDTLCSKFDFISYSISQEQLELKEIGASIRKFKKKKMWKAALYSAAIPGLGKNYVGKPGEFGGAFFPILGLAALTAESYLVTGLYQPHFWIFASGLTVFYIGNIWGSALSVKRAEKQFEHEVNDKILLNMHLAIRRIYN
ncbi:MAG: hypothetical protein SFY32_15735 [Bacteroidota bacterium]|nr:hypothetical protein [Bacteroidota bacterium]